MALKTNNFVQGDIWLFNPDPTTGNEVGKKNRPGLIISCNAFNRGKSGLVIVVPLTSKQKGVLTHVQIDPPEGGLLKTSYCMCEHVRSISVERLIKKIGIVRSFKILHEVREWISDLTLVE
jgi:mRNA interferase MazF